MTQRHHLTDKALDVQLDLLRYYESTPGRTWAGAVAVAMFFDDDDARSNWSETIEDYIERFGQSMHLKICGVGATYAVTSEIIDVIESAAPSVPSFTLHPNDLPSREGFVYFERNVHMFDSFGKGLAVRGFGWMMARRVPDHEPMDLTAPVVDQVLRGIDVPRPVYVTESEPGRDDGIALLLWTDPSDPYDQMYEEWRNADGNIELRRVKERGNKIVEFKSQLPPNGLLSMIGGTWQFDTEPPTQAQLEQHVYEKGDFRPINVVNYASMFKFLITFFRFIDEEWIDARMYTGSRPATRRATRVNVKPEVKVVHLRRRGGDRNYAEGTGTTDWQHRWLVRGHWRNQWYPSIQQHRPKWIAEYVKGPDDKPLIVHDNIFSVDR